MIFVVISIITYMIYVDVYVEQYVVSELHLRRKFCCY